VENTINNLQIHRRKGCSWLSTSSRKVNGMETRHQGRTLSKRKNARKLRENFWHPQRTSIKKKLRALYSSLSNLKAKEKGIKRRKLKSTGIETAIRRVQERSSNEVTQLYLANIDLKRGKGATVTIFHLGTWRQRRGPKEKKRSAE